MLEGGTLSKSRPDVGAVAVLLGSLAGALFVGAVVLGMKWVLLFVFLAAGAAAVVLVSARLATLELFCLCAFVIGGSARIDFHIGHSPTSRGFPVSVLDVLWLALMILWGLRLSLGREQVAIGRRYHLPYMIILFGVLIAGLRAPTIDSGLRAITLVGQTYLLFLYLMNRRLEERDCSWIAAAAAFTLVVQAAIGVLQEATQSTLGLDFFGASEATLMGPEPSGASFSRVGGTMGHPNRFANFLGSLLFVPLGMVFARRGWTRIIYGVVFLVGLVPLLLTRSRGGWIGFFAVLVFLMSIAAYRRLGTLRAGMALLWAGGLLALGALTFPTTSERLLEDDYGSAESRIPMSLTAINLIADNPVFGVGHDNYTLRFHAYDASADGQTYRFVYPVHNAFLLLAAENGVAVLLAFCGILWLFFRDCWSLRRARLGELPEAIGIAVAAGVACKLIAWLVAVAKPMMDPYLWFLMGLAVSVVEYYRGGRREQAPER
jgi:O-antigen ligase